MGKLGKWGESTYAEASADKWENGKMGKLGEWG